MGELRERFKNPPAEYRGIPFWSWNDKLQPDEITRQIIEMKQQGMGGFFMHSREGLETEYMGEEWMECIEKAVETAKETGIGAWLYDEDRWPSGAAGGLVPAAGGDNFRAKALEMKRIKGEFIPEENVLAIFKLKLDGMNALDYQMLDNTNRFYVTDNEVVVLFAKKVSSTSEWFNNDAPADNLNPQAVRSFLDTTYEMYKKHVGEEFGNAIPGIFTDEPGVSYFIPDAASEVLNPVLARVPWTDGFSEVFEKSRGYDLLKHLPCLFYDSSFSPKVRHDFWRTVTEQFVFAFSKQIGEWCENNDLVFTGHFMQENDLFGSTRMCGAIMPHFEYQRIPGIDMLCEQTDEYLTVKQSTSVANQFGRKHVLTETYGCTGWKFTFEGQKWVGDWQYILGVTLRCQHLALYSLRGCRKRDYPPAFSYNTCWWKYNNVAEDYFARLGLMLSEGKAVRDLLVIHPVSTAWARMCSKNEYEIRALGQKFNQLSKALCAFHFDHDFGDEMLMSKWARTEYDRLYVNQASYKIVLIPGMDTIFDSTLRILWDFLDGGGKIISMTPHPYMIEGEKTDKTSKRLDKFFSHQGIRVVNELNELSLCLESLLSREVSILDENGIQAQKILYMQRNAGEREIFGFVNNDLNTAHKTEIHLNCAGDVEEWDLLNGRVKAVKSYVKDGKTVFNSEFGPVGSKVYVVNKKTGSVEQCKPKDMFPLRNERISASYIGPKCDFSRTWPNALTLDMCRYKISGSVWSETMPVWEAQRKVREALGMRQVYKNRLPQRYKWIYEKHPGDGTSVSFQFEFGIKDLPKAQIFAVIERSGEFEIYVNGRIIEKRPEGWYLDRSFDKIPIDYLEEGINVITLDCRYRNDMEMEDIYIIGDFGVDLTTRFIVKEPAVLHMGDWCAQGYPHYCGSIIYKGVYDYAPSDLHAKAILTLGRHSAVTVEIRINGLTAGHIPWRAADGLDITSFLNEGVNMIEIEVMGSPRNLLGPLHQAAGHKPWTDWSVFRTEGSEFCDEYVLQQYGLMDQVRIEIFSIEG